MPDSVVIVGAGLAGYTVARELRKLAPARRITLVTADSGDVYSKPMLSNALAQGHSPAALIQTPAAEQAAKLGIEIRAHSPVRALRPDAREIDTDTGPIAYGDLVLALGARPRALPVPGGEHALSVNHLDDYTRFRARLFPGARVCILGAGLVGCEFANDLALAGHPVSLVDHETRPLARLLPEALATRLQQALHGVSVAGHFGSQVSVIERHGETYTVELANGSRIEADLVLAAIGLEAESSLARDAGLDVGRGIRVDTLLATSAPHIHALGDCVEVGGLVLPYVLPLMQQARTLAATLAGTPTRLSLPALPVAVKTPACPIVTCPPPAGSAGEWHMIQDNASGAHYQFRHQDTLQGFALAGNACTQRRQLAQQAPALLVG